MNIGTWFRRASDDICVLGELCEEFGEGLNHSYVLPDQCRPHLGSLVIKSPIQAGIMRGDYMGHAWMRAAMVFSVERLGSKTHFDISDVEMKYAQWILAYAEAYHVKILGGVPTDRKPSKWMLNEIRRCWRDVPPALPVVAPTLATAHL